MNTGSKRTSTSKWWLCCWRQNVSPSHNGAVSANGDPTHSRTGETTRERTSAQWIPERTNINGVNGGVGRRTVSSSSQTEQNDQSYRLVDADLQKVQMQRSNSTPAPDIQPIETEISCHALPIEKSQASKKKRKAVTRGPSLLQRLQTFRSKKSDNTPSKTTNIRPRLAGFFRHQRTSTKNHCLRSETFEESVWKMRTSKLIVKKLEEPIRARDEVKLDVMLTRMSKRGNLKLVDVDNTGSLLILSISVGSEATLAVLLRHYQSLRDLKFTILHPVIQALRFKKFSVVDQLLSYGINLETRHGDDLSTPLHYAIKLHDFDSSALLLRKGSVNIGDIYGQTPLHTATLQNDASIVTMLLQEACDVTKADKSGWTALHLSVLQNNAELIRILLSYKAPVNVATKYGRTPLHLACTNNSLELVNLLVEHGAATTVRDCHDRTPSSYTTNLDIKQFLKSRTEQHKTCLTMEHLSCTLRSSSLIDILLVKHPEMFSSERVLEDDNLVRSHKEAKKELSTILEIEEEW